MALSSYADLKVAVASWLNRADLTASIPDFITLCEAQMRREITSVGHIDNFADVEVDEYGWTLPCKVDEVQSVTYQGRPLGYLSPDRQEEFTGSVPGYYTIDGNVLKVVPVGTVTIRLANTFCALSSSVACNWLLREHPDVYLYGALMQAAPFLRDDDRVSVWGSLFSSAIDSINQREIRRQVGSNLRVQAGATP